MRSVWTKLASGALWTVALVFFVWLVVSAWNDSPAAGLGNTGWLLANAILLGVGVTLVFSGLLPFEERCRSPWNISFRPEFFHGSDVVAGLPDRRRCS